MVALGRVVFTTREHVIAIEPRGNGTPRPHARLSLRSPRPEILFRRHYCREIPNDMLDLAIGIVRSKTRHFQPEKFEDHYERALKKLIGKKWRGEKIEKAREHPQAQVINLMDALRRSGSRSWSYSCSRSVPACVSARRSQERTSWDALTSHVKANAFIDQRSCRANEVSKPSAD